MQRRPGELIATYGSDDFRIELAVCIKALIDERATGALLANLG
jgi:hypothetical protein